MTDRIPVAYIESEKRRISDFIYEAAADGDMDRAYQLTCAVSTLEALITNWKYATGPYWRETHND